LGTDASETAQRRELISLHLDTQNARTMNDDRGD
jgi:hypothetical protein